MIKFSTEVLKNGLTVIHHYDNSTPMVTVNLLYKVGSRNESPNRTGLAHLFEHLMFGGSQNAPQYDYHVQRAGGECNAFTTSDFTNYYITLPAQNIETALWLESDRMHRPLLNQQTLKVQKSVVIEEFQQRYLNQPYGDAYLLLKPLAYKVHPYSWNTIGKNTEHIADATLEEVLEFYRKHYVPNNAILVVAGNVQAAETFAMATKWFDAIPSGANLCADFLPEPLQTGARTLSVERNVPASSIYVAYRMPQRLDKGYYACDLLSDILSNGKSSRLYRKLLQEQGLFSQINAHVSGDVDEGLFTVTGILLPTTSMEQAEQAIEQELEQLCNDAVSDYELEKVKNKIESMHIFTEMAISQKAMNLAYANMLGDTNSANTEIENYRNLSLLDLQRQAVQTFDKNKRNILYYRHKKV
jgi:predicted Zn-dependent peptidase